MEPIGTAIIQGHGTLIPVPSGQPVTLQEVVWDVPGPQGWTARFRFVAPRIAPGDGNISFDQSAADIQHLCDAYALPRITEYGIIPSQIIISFSEKPIPLGVAAPELTQFFEAFTLKDGACIWDIF